MPGPAPRSQGKCRQMALRCEDTSTPGCVPSRSRLAREPHRLGSVTRPTGPDDLRAAGLRRRRLQAGEDRAIRRARASRPAGPHAELPGRSGRQHPRRQLRVRRAAPRPHGRDGRRHRRRRGNSCASTSRSCRSRSSTPTPPTSSCSVPELLGADLFHTPSEARGRPPVGAPERRRRSGQRSKRVA